VLESQVAGRNCGSQCLEEFLETMLDLGIRVESWGCEPKGSVIVPCLGSITFGPLSGVDPGNGRLNGWWEMKALMAL
jgi:hypothetical protein